MVVTWTLEAEGAALVPAPLLTSSVTVTGPCSQLLPLCCILLAPALLDSDEEVGGGK